MVNLTNDVIYKLKTTEIIIYDNSNFANVCLFYSAVKLKNLKYNFKLKSFLINDNNKICMFKRSKSFKYYFESHLIYKRRYYRQTILNQINIMVPYVDIISLCFRITILWEIFVMRHKCHVRSRGGITSIQTNANYRTWSIDFG